jgi:pyruvate ferredoxin oxidoreductase delta subunit
MGGMKRPGWRALPLAAIITQPGSSKRYRTGDWRVLKPVIDGDKCVRCLICWIYCPEPAIKRVGEDVAIDYTFCKGCGICATECPAKAISMVKEGT